MTSPRILVADDSSEMRALLKDIIGALGYEVTCVSSGARALSEMRARPPDLLITDLFMPGMSGFSLRSVMLRRPDLATIPVIILSAYWHRSSDTLDVAAVLMKPLNIDRLIAVVRELVPIEPEAHPVEPHPATTTGSGEPADPATPSAGGG